MRVHIRPSFTKKKKKNVKNADVTTRIEGWNGKKSQEEVKGAQFSLKRQSPSSGGQDRLKEAEKREREREKQQPVREESRY